MRLFPMGDSITDGGLKVRSYRYHLYQLLSHAGMHVEWLGSMQGVYDRRKGRNASTGVVIAGQDDWPLAAQRHEGHWGWTSKQLLHGHERQPQRGSLPAWLRNGCRLIHGVPDAVLVKLGTNDLTKYVARGTEDVTAIARRMSTIMQRLCRASPHAVILLASPIPYCRFRDDHSIHLLRRRKAEAELARKLRNIASRGIAACATNHLVYVNMSAAVQCNGLVADGVHPGPTAALQMATQWHTALLPFLGDFANASRWSEAERRGWSPAG